MKKMLTVLLAGVFATSAFAVEASAPAASEMAKPVEAAKPVDHAAASSSKKHAKKKSHHHHHKSSKKAASGQAGM